MLKPFVRAWFRLSKKERAGIVTLLALVLASCYTPDIIFYFRRVPVADTAGFYAAVQTFEAQLRNVEPLPEKAFMEVKHSLFRFDPNTLPPEGWLRLGVPDRTVRTIGRYLAKGGHFRKAADLQKVYGLSARLYQQLQPYVMIKEEMHPSKPALTVTYKRDTLQRSYHGKSHAAPIDINTADTLAWQTLPGIGPGFARRIVAFRDRLGGFYETAQIAETYGLPDSTFKKIQPFLKISDGSLKKMDLNLTDEKSLAAHPYIRYKLAHLIVQYRSAHAGFSRVEELKTLPLVDDIIYRKIEHYIVIKL
ncbi:ComEA family DNA-binding protein [Chitinophaga vietnamensis]|uniref:ComEA family DNA-binding protein n=1 Tax=Chitinophaga vietnamensis TaxID=2593957 RepID=UPI0011777A64|nr:helix-hairpin-helix domain-containing protein [Chitinophaga vietnamensis]